MFKAKHERSKHFGKHLSSVGVSPFPRRLELGSLLGIFGMSIREYITNLFPKNAQQRPSIDCLAENDLNFFYVIDCPVDDKTPLMPAQGPLMGRAGIEGLRAMYVWNVFGYK